jgi:hypothetical protein
MMDIDIEAGGGVSALLHRSEDNRSTFTFRRAPGGETFEIRAIVEDDRLEARRLWMVDDSGVLKLHLEEGPMR